MADIKFRDTAHRDFFLENMMKCRVNDCYHRAFFYVMGIASETRANINQMFNFKEDCIEPEGMHGGWQTTGIYNRNRDRRIILFAYVIFQR